MKRQRRIWVLMVAVTAIALSVPTMLWSQIVTVETAGTLSTLLATDVTKAKINGKINGTDVKYLRKLINEGSLSSLDLSESKIVSGGVAYYNNYTTKDDIIGDYMFRECTKLKKIVLPTTITTIASNAFSKSGLTEIDIPNSVSRLGGDAFAYCSSLTKAVVGKRVSQMDQGVFYSSPVKNIFVKPMVPPSNAAYLLSSKPTIRVYTDALADYKESDWKNFGTIVGGLENYYPLEPDSTDVINGIVETFFDDAACTSLKAEYSAMSNEELTAAMTEAKLPSFMVEIALKIKNADWKRFEQDFRIHSYNAYSDAAYWNNLLMSTGGSYMGNPTGIYAADNGLLYVFVDQDVPENATLYFAGCVGNKLITSAKTGTKLKKGLNIIESTKDALYYIVYTADTKSKTKKLSEWPAIKIHIEGGVVNGYYDVSRHSNSEYVAILKGATHELFTVRGGQSLFNFKTATYRKVWPSTIDKSISWFDSLTVWEKELMGFCESVATGQRSAEPHCLTGGESIFPCYYNNPNFAIQGESSDAGYANSSPFRTSYNSENCISASFNVARNDQDDWCAAHECGHNNQRAINLEGCTESSNNLFSNVIRFLTGRVTSSGASLSTVMNESANHIPFPIRDVNSKLRMYYQLYLYYHLGRQNTAFYPTLFQELRKDPLTLWGSANNSTLKFVRKVCEVAQEDLTDFFRAWGFFEPCSVVVDDYGSHSFTVRQTDINRTLQAISQYPKKNRQILFVEDRADYVLTRDYLTAGGKLRRESDLVGKCGDLGQYTSFLANGCEPSNYTYLQVDSLYAMEGNGGIGFVVLDADDNMIYASNALSFCIPTSLGTNYTICSIDVDGTLHPTTFSGSGFANIQLEKVGTLSSELSEKMIGTAIAGNINGTDFKYLRKLINENNLIYVDLSASRPVSGGEAYYQTYRTSLNNIGDYVFSGCTQLMTMYLPESITRIGSNAFSRAGLYEAVIPDLVVSVGGDAFAYCPQLTRVVVGEKVRTMSQGVFYSSPVKEAFVKPMTPPTISAYLFSSKPIIHVHAAALDDYKASAWADFGTLVGDLDDYPDLDAIHDVISPLVTTDDNAVYDLFGRRVTHLQSGTIYIRGRHKFICK